MGKQQDMFNPIQEDGHTLHWHKFYAPYKRQLARERNEKEQQNSSEQISILIKPIHK